MTDDAIPERLNTERIAAESARVCREANQSQDRWIFAPAGTGTLTDAVDTSLLWGITRRAAVSHDAAAAAAASGNSQMCTCYLAYSTWEGRVLFWDKLVHVPDEDDDRRRHHHGPNVVDLSSSPSSSHGDVIVWTRLLAKLAKALSCRRLVWRHAPGTLPASYGGVSEQQPDLKAETLDGWLTLYWEFPALRAYAPYHPKGTEASLSTTQQAFAMALEQAQHDRFRLRWATHADVDHIDRLIMGLAIFEKERESYILSKQQLRQDGFGSGNHPLYYCILVDDTTTTGKEEPYTCAMAFCYLGYELGEGRFLYLEDLFFEEAYRGQGGGKLVMSTLALVAQSLQCTKAVWVSLLISQTKNKNKFQLTLTN